MPADGKSHKKRRLALERPLCPTAKIIHGKIGTRPWFAVRNAEYA